MGLQRFLLVIRFNTDCPEEINPARWKGMIKFYNRREQLGEPFEFPEMSYHETVMEFLARVKPASS